MLKYFQFHNENDTKIKITTVMFSCKIVAYTENHG